MATEVRAISDVRWPDGVRLPVVLTFEHQSGEGTPLLPGDRPNYMMGGALEYGGRTGIWNILEVLDTSASTRRSSSAAPPPRNIPTRCAPRTRPATRSPA